MVKHVKSVIGDMICPYDVLPKKHILTKLSEGGKKGDNSCNVKENDAAASAVISIK